MTEAEYASLPLQSKYDFLKTISERLPGFSPVERWNNVYLREEAGGCLFSYIPAGTFEQGFSEAEQRTAESIFSPVPANYEEMRPVKTVHIPAFLLSCFPFTESASSGEEPPAYPLVCPLSRAKASAVPAG